MEPPKYIDENRYSYLTSASRQSANIDYEVETPELAFARRLQSIFLQGQRHLHHEEFALALDTFRELRSLILKTAHPSMPVDPNQSTHDPLLPVDPELQIVFIQKAIDILKEIPVVNYEFPASVISEESMLPANIQEQLRPSVESGLQITSYHATVLENIRKAMAAAEKDDWASAVNHYSAALEKVPDEDFVVRASLMNDMAILNEKAGNRATAIEQGREGVQLFAESTVPNAHVHALDTMVGIFARAGQPEEAANAAREANELRAEHNLHPVISASILSNGLRRPAEAIDIAATARIAAARIATVASEVNPGASGTSVLMGTEYLPASPPLKKVTVHGDTSSAEIILNETAISFHQLLSTTPDIGLLTAFWRTPVYMVAYLPSILFFVIPMSIGDCLLGLGNLKEAEEQYLGALQYAPINRVHEVVKLWTRLADVYLEMGDEAYRRAKDDPAGFDEAKSAYENIVLVNGTLNPDSPLYKDQKFELINHIKTRVSDFLATPDPSALNDNPSILTRVLQAKVKLDQIQAGLNFFGFSPEHLPPFSFEYLQNTARYFAQQASHIEQRYIQYKSTGENEELHREQLDQQAEVGRQSVVLEQRGVAEAQAGIGVAQASVNYSETQRDDAIATRDDFENVRWELLGLAELEAWASASSVDRDEQIKLTISGSQYYSSSEKRRNVVLQELAYQRTRLSHDLEAKRLQRAIDSATAYKAIAEAQLAQARARKAIAEQRVQIAQLQQRYAEENRDFLDMKEFSARLWFELAREARRLSQRYLDMATEAALLMERAYNAETARDLNVIRFDYSQAQLGNLMGADLLLRDIDHFTLDYVTTTKNKKAPVKKTISLADKFPMAFHQLKTEGRCFFQTELADFDREHSGFYLCKVCNVELVFVGITEATTFIAGTLRNVGVSRFRRENGEVVTTLYPSDVMPLSQYDVRQDMLVFRFNPNELRLFENNGIDTLWQLELPMDANDFDLNEILDIQLVLYYDGFFSPTLEESVKASLPASGSASRAFTMRMMFPDELFFLKNQGDAELVFEAGMFPRNQTNLKRTDVTLKVSGDPSVVAGLKLRLISAGLAGELILETNADGEVNDSTPGQPLRDLRDRSMLDQWSLKITPEDNPALVNGGALDLGGINDILIFFEYDFDYR